MPCCIDRMRFSPRLAIRKNNFLLFFQFLFFCTIQDLFVSGFVRVANCYFNARRLWTCLLQVCRNTLDLLQKLPRAGLFVGSGNIGESYLLGLLAKIKCSICSYQLNLWYVAHGVT